MAPGARSKFGASMFEPEVFRNQMYCIEESTCDIVGTFRRSQQSFGAPEVIRRRGNCAPFASRYDPGQWSSNHRPWNYKMYTGGDTTRFLGMWLVDYSRGNTVARVLPGRGKIAEHWPNHGYKKVGDHCLSV